MSDPHDFEEWSRGARQPARRDSSFDPAGETDPGVADLWGESSEPVPYRRASRRPDWLAPALVIVLATLAFATAWFVTRGAGSSPNVAQPSGATAPSNTSSTQMPSTSGPSDPSASDSSTSATSSSTSPATRASFPADAVATCGSGEAVPTSSVRLARGTNSTCAYVGDVVNKVNAHLEKNPDATTYTISPYSTTLRKIVSLNCTRADHLSACSGGSNVRLWVSDSVG